MTDSQSQQNSAPALADILERLASSQKACFDAGQHIAAMDIQSARATLASILSAPAVSPGEPVAKTAGVSHAAWLAKGLDSPSWRDYVGLAAAELHRLSVAPAPDMRAAVIEPADGHGYTGEFTATEFNERAWDHEKAAKNGLSAGPNVSYVRTFQACAVALRYAAEHMFSQAPDPSTARIALLEAALNSIRSNANCHTKDLALATMPLIFQTATRAIRGDSI